MGASPRAWAGGWLLPRGLRFEGGKAHVRLQSQLMTGRGSPLSPSWPVRNSPGDAGETCSRGWPGSGSTCLAAHTPKARPGCRMSRSTRSQKAARPFVCDREGCGKAFVRDYHLTRHVLIHTGEKPFVCTASGCDQKFNTKSNLKKHFERKHENQQKQYVCTFEGCEKAFKKHQQLRTHQCQHTSEPLFNIETGFQATDTAAGVRIYDHRDLFGPKYLPYKLSVNFPEWRYPGKRVKCVSAPPEAVRCEVCQKTFKRKDYLKQHMKTHAPEREVCRCPREGCGRTYTTVFNLQSHILSFHEERRPFTCEHAGCGKTFAMKQSLTRHAVVHDPDKKKMNLKVKPSREKRSLASRLSGYIPPKKKQGQSSSLPTNGESLNCTEGRVLSTVAILTLN
ncbi:transcription factor iiia-like [Lynx pardinus]|uniref:Transcription factor IIIA n=1 Tax=Lynx pardinus TaxID=191816 RepID=A0A485MHZ3_LYNPA|nr:transcription factor iiia-like [Lynx pardinus]